MSFNHTLYATADYGDRPYTYSHASSNLLHPQQPEENSSVQLSQFYREHQQNNTEHAHFQYGGQHPIGGESRPFSHHQNGDVQFPSECSYQFPAEGRPLFPVYYPWQAPKYPGLQSKTHSSCAEEITMNHAHSDAGSHSSSTSGSPYMSSTDPPISSNSSSGYGSSSGSTSSSPYPSPSLPEPAPTGQIDAGPTANPTVPPIEDGPTVKPKKARTSYSTEQIHTLETAFKENAYPDYDKLEELAKTLGVTERKIKVWFQNKRARWRKKHAAEPVYNPDMYSAPTAVASKISTPTDLPFNTTSGYSAPTKPYPILSKPTAPSNYSVQSQYLRPGPMLGLYPPHTPAMYPNQASMPTFRPSQISSEVLPAKPGYPGTKTTASSAIGFLPSSIPGPSGEPSVYGASPYQSQFPVPQMFSLR